MRAIPRPSPPLFPVPHTTPTRRLALKCSANHTTNARHARSMRSMEAMGSLLMVKASHSLIWPEESIFSMGSNIETIGLIAFGIKPGDLLLGLMLLPDD